MEQRGTAGVVLPACALAVVAVGLALLVQACQSLPPSNLDDLCGLFQARPGWRDAAEVSRERWGLPEPVLMAMIHQESRFRPRARPGWRRLLGIIPLGPRSSAFGYGQVKDGTWDDYVRASGNRDARRDAFADVADFIGWYSDVIERATAVPKSDAFHLYLAYHEGPAGYARRSFDAKPWLLGVARKVRERATLYAAQHARCGGPLPADTREAHASLAP